MSRRILVLVAVLTAAVVLVGCGSQAPTPVEVQVTLSDFKVEASPATVPANTLVKFVVTNNGSLEHEMVVEKKGDVDKPLETASGPAEAEKIPAGGSKTLEWTFTEPGQYQLACHVPGHFEAGMVTDLTVTK